jgi:hypothetical protein
MTLASAFKWAVHLASNVVFGALEAWQVAALEALEPLRLRHN